MHDKSNRPPSEGTDDNASNTLDLEGALCMSSEALVELAKKHSLENSILKLNVALPNVGSASSPSDIAYDYLDALYVGEVISKHCKTISAAVLRVGYGLCVVFSMCPSDAEKWAGELRNLAIGLERYDDSDDNSPGESWEATEEKILETKENVNELEDDILSQSRVIAFPELADLFIANFIHGDRYDEGREHWDKEYPTWSYGFWKSAISKEAGCDLYTSADFQNAWIVLADECMLEGLLSRYGGLSESGSKLYPSESLQVTGGPHVIVSKRNVVYAPSSTIGSAMECWEKCLRPTGQEPDSLRVIGKQRNGDESGRFSRLDSVDISQSPSIGGFDDQQAISWRMTEDGQAAVASRENVHFVAFLGSNCLVRPEEIRRLLSKLENAADSLRHFVGLPPSFPGDWQSIDDEVFEELCYDVLSCSGRFDETTIRKHGKTRSRDGGRDIEIWTRPRPGKPSVKWIYQCKYLSGGRSLSASRVNNISDVVDQYDAGGFGVMTNAVIDSTLYDRMDAISKKKASKSPTGLVLSWSDLLLLVLICSIGISKTLDKSK